VCSYFVCLFLPILIGSFNICVSKTFVTANLRQVLFLQLYILCKDIDLVMHMHVKNYNGLAV